jgi:hypothetical protein
MHPVTAVSDRCKSIASINKQQGELGLRPVFQTANPTQSCGTHGNMVGTYSCQKTLLNSSAKAAVSKKPAAYSCTTAERMSVRCVLSCKQTGTCRDRYP